MEATILGYLRGKKRQCERDMLILPDNVKDYKEASKLIGRKIVFKDDNGNTYKGTIVGVHGRRGVVIARFVRGLPGQAIGKRVLIY